MYQVEISRSFKAKQGLKSPVRASDGLAPLGSDFDAILKVGIIFQAEQLTERGWFVDTDAVEKQVAAISEYLASDTWTKLFDFRPTFELVSKWVADKLHEIPQLEYVELENRTIPVKTRYTVRPR